MVKSLPPGVLLTPLIKLASSSSVLQYFNAFHNAPIINSQNNIKNRYSSFSLNSNYIFNTSIVKRNDGNNINVMFIKLNKIYNKGKFARNKQIYRTGVI